MDTRRAVGSSGRARLIARAASAGVAAAVPVVVGLLLFVSSVDAAPGGLGTSLPTGRGGVVDTKPPRTIVLRGLGRRIETVAKRAQIQIRFRADERARFECRVGVRRWRHCASPLPSSLGASE